MKLPKFLTGKSKTIVRVLNSTEIRLETWQSAPELVTQARRVFAMPEFRAMLDVLRTESPSNYGFPSRPGLSSDDRVAHACKIEGYNLCLNNLEALARLETAKGMLEATFEPEQAPASVLATAIPDEPKVNY